MPNIIPVNNLTNIKSKKLSTKLSFKVDEVFKAKAIGEGENGNEVKLKMVDGFEFTASLEENSEPLKEGITKFKVVGREDGKIKLKVLKDSGEGNKNISKDSIESLIEKLDININKKEYAILEKMVKHNIPITKENISDVMNLLDFASKAKSSPKEIEDFIKVYMESRNISPNSKEGQAITNILKGVFNNMKNMSEEDLFLFLENGIDLTSENIKSFNDTFKGTNSIYKGLKTVENLVKDNNVQNENKLNNENPDSVSINNTKTEKDLASNIKNLINEIDKEINNGSNIKNQQSNINQPRENTNVDQKSNIKEKKILNTLKQLINSGNKENVSIAKEILGKMDSTTQKSILQKLSSEESLSLKDGDNSLNNASKEVVSNKESIINKENNKSTSSNLKTLDNGNISKENVKNVNKNENGSKVVNKDTLAKEGTNVEENINNEKLGKDIKGNSKFKNINNGKSSVIKNQINEKTLDMKNIIKDLLKNINNDKSNMNYDKVMNVLKNNINDFKLFNTLSNEYYYLDLPLSLKEQEYQCKIVIKDERGKGKKIDSKDVKIAASVSTVNMDIVDIYIKVKNENMDVNIKSLKTWIPMLSKNKEKLLKDLEKMGYNIYVSLDEKKEDLNISSCSKFFDDKNLNAVDIMA